MVSRFSLSKKIFTAKTDKSIFSYSLLLREKGDRDSGG